MATSSITRTAPGGTVARAPAAPATVGVPPPAPATDPYNPSLWPNFSPNYGAAFAGQNMPGLWNALGGQSANTFDQIGNLGYGGYFSGQGWPGQATNDLDQMMNVATSNEQQDQWRNFISQNQGFWPAQAGNLTHLAKYGLPGTQQLQQEQQGLAGIGGGLIGGQGGYGVSDLLNQIYSQGLPNQQGVQEMFGQQAGMGQGAQQAALSQLMGLRGGAPGQQDAMSAVRQLLQGQPQTQAQAQSQFSGLMGNQPGAQQQAGNIFGGLAGYTPGIQGTAANALNSLIQGGGLSPEFIEASRRQILQPSKEQLLGNINQMSGGASLSSPVYQELLRKQEQDFNDSMIRAGMGNLGGFLGQGLQAGGQQFGQQQGIGQALAGLGGQQFGQQLGTGQALAGLGGQQYGQQLGAAETLGNLGNQGFGQQIGLGGALANLGQGGIQNALQSFGAVPGALAPYAQMGAGLGSDLLNQSLQRYATGNQLGLQGLQTTQGMATDPMQMLQQAQFGGVDRQQQLLNTLLSSGLNYQGLMQQQGLGQQGMQADIMRSILGGEYANEANRAQLEAANKGIWGQLGAAAISAIPGIMKAAPALSARQFKRNIESFKDKRAALERVNRIPLRKYRFKDEIIKDDKQHLGWILDEVDPEFVSKDGITIDLQSTLGHLVASVQALTEEVARLKKERNG